MDLAVVSLVAALLFGWGLVSARVQRVWLTGPIVFTGIGAVLTWSGMVDGPQAAERLLPLVELTLVWVLFSDAARLPLSDLRRDLGRYVRLLAIGLPLTIVLGWGLAAGFFPDLGVWLTLFVGAALAPTDAALGVPVVTNPAVPKRIRELITVESGLNDGIATPVVMMAIAGATAAAGIANAEGTGRAAVQLLVGAAVGTVLGAAGGWLLRVARRRGLAAEEFTGISVLALAVLAYAGSQVAGGNGFVAAFCGGLAFGATAGRRGPEELVFLEQVGGVVSLLVWLAFGAIAIPIMLEALDVRTVAYAVLSLTLVRLLPVAVALAGAGLDRRTVLFIGWFGPRGLASLVFALLALEALGDAADEAVAVVGVTVLLSVVAHGLSAMPLATRFGSAERDAALRADDAALRGDDAALPGDDAEGAPGTSTPPRSGE